jgi:hypothetical protein
MCRWAACLLAAASLLTTLSGCVQQKLVPVEGIVTLDGEAVPGATVTFMPEGNEGRPATGLTDDDGVFRLTTYQSGDGAQRGNYRILVAKSAALAAPPAFEPGDEEKIMNHYRAMKAQRRNKPLLPARYSDQAKTPLHCMVPAEQPVRLELQGDPKPK